jgi:hypothetical protein
MIIFVSESQSQNMIILGRSYPNFNLNEFVTIQNITYAYSTRIIEY